MDSLPIIKSPRLQPNQTVGIIAPASPVNQSEISEGLKLLESFPLKIKQGEHIFDRQDYLAGSDNDRVSDLHQMFSDPDIQAIFCARGGYGSARFLNKIDFDLIRKKNKNWEHLSRLIGMLYKPRISFKQGKEINKGIARGTLLGGNLSTLCSLLATPFLPSFEGVILFLEEKGESPYKLDRMLTQLLLSGRLNRLSALIIGQIEDCGKMEIINSML
ncbi:MAG: LD-carboxypeptidase, partial [Deltaproteobacteria bacterium]|nr:LD-carboxypeptidase [Deltaproteobacteria bacterium]